MAGEAESASFEASFSGAGAAMQHRPWRKHCSLSSALARFESFLAGQGFERAPWVAVGFGAGIAVWFQLDGPWQWLALLAAGAGTGLAALALLPVNGRFPFIRQALTVMALVLAAGCATVWTKSSLVGAEPVARPFAGVLSGKIISREEQPAQQRARIVLATREPETGRAIRVRLNLPLALDQPGAREGALISVKARLVPPAPPLLPGSYNFARAAWFEGLAATGSVLGDLRIERPATGGAGLSQLSKALSVHVRSRLSGSAGGIAAAFASGDRGGIAAADEEAMRDAGLTHLLSISGLHVSAVVAAAYVLAIRLLALWPWLALRVRLPMLAAGAAASAGIGYTLLTGAEVPTVRSCVGAVLVLLAVALGREALSLRMVAVAAIFVMLLWPEAVVGPSFQMSFAAVISIVALHGATPIRAFLAPRDDGWWGRAARQIAMLLLTGIVIELALMPIGMFHFHRAGVYGAFANVVAIPLTTFVTMPLIALALLLDAVGAGAPAWWLAGQSLDALLALAHWTAAQPGAVTQLPAMGDWRFALYLAGALWVALWRGNVRLWGLIPAGLAAVSLFFLRAPDVLVSGDGRHVGVTGEVGADLLVLREGRSSFARDTLQEIAGMSGEVRPLAEWPGAQCSADYCVLVLKRGGRDWRLLISRGRDAVAERELAAACERAEIVIADRWLPWTCRPLVLKADRALLERSGGLALDLGNGTIRTVADGEGRHGWWRPER